MAVLHKDAQIVASGGVTNYYFNYTTLTFTKREIPLSSRGISQMTGQPVTPPFFKERFQLEATALQFIKANTTIPVPDLTSLIPGAQLLRVGEECRMPERHCPSRETPEEEECQQFWDLARTNFLRFVQEIPLPQLRSLKSNTTGLDGLVLPPTFIMNSIDKDSLPSEMWTPEISDREEYVMVHGDLGPHNVMMDLRTLEVAAIIDWEYSGFFPEGFQKWGATMREHFSYFEDEEKVKAKVVAGSIGL